MKRKQIELFVLVIVVLLIIGYAVIFMGNSGSESKHIMQKYFIGVGVAIFIGYSYFTQMRDRQLIDGLMEKNNELRHKIANREETIKKLKSDLSSCQNELKISKEDKEAQEREFKNIEVKLQKEIEELKSKIAEL